MSPPFQPGTLDRLESERLRLRRPAESDRDEIRLMHADREVMATLGGVRDAAASDEVFDGLVAHWDAHGFGYWIARDARSGAFAGRSAPRGPRPPRPNADFRCQTSIFTASLRSPARNAG